MMTPQDPHVLAQAIARIVAAERSVDAAGELCAAVPAWVGHDGAALYVMAASPPAPAPRWSFIDVALGRNPGRGDGGRPSAPEPAQRLHRFAWASLPASLVDKLPAELDPGDLGPLTRAAADAGVAAELVALPPTAFGDSSYLVLFKAGAPTLDADTRAALADAAGAVLGSARMCGQLRARLVECERGQDQLVQRERLRALGEMALGVAHDFNNTLNAILGHIGVLELGARDGAQVAAVLGRIKQSALDGAETVSRLQDFSRQRRDQEFAGVDLAALVREVGDAIARREPSLRVDVRAPETLAVSGAADELRDAIEAVAANAVDAMSGAGRLTLILHADDGEARLVVSDTGPGMSEEVRRRAFDPFFTTKGPHAAGLGLSVAYGVIERHGGQIEIESRLGAGTRVSLRLPLAVPRAVEAPRPVAAKPAPAATADPARRSLRLLLVEDDDDNREAMASLLGVGGYHVAAVPSGRKGVERFRPDDFDLVVTDLGLPDMSGWDVAAAIKQRAPSTPIALITGWGLNLEAGEIRRRGVDLLIKKPIDPTKFLERLARLAQAGPSAPLPT